jgi:hypothetical protein
MIFSRRRTKSATCCKYRFCQNPFAPGVNDIRCIAVYRHFPARELRQATRRLQMMGTVVHAMLRSDIERNAVALLR